MSLLMKVILFLSLYNMVASLLYGIFIRIPNRIRYAKEMIRRSEEIRKQRSDLEECDLNELYEGEIPGLKHVFRPLFTFEEDIEDQENEEEEG